MAAIHSEVRGLERESLMPIEPAKPVGPVHNLTKLNKRVIARTVVHQAKQARYEETLVGRVRAAFRRLFSKASLFGSSEPIARCHCSCAFGGPSDQDPHFVVELGGYAYRICRYCAANVGFDPEKLQATDYYFCFTEAPKEHSRNVAEAIRHGEVEAYLACQTTSTGEVRSGSDGSSVPVAGADDPARESGTADAELRGPGAVGSGVATREHDRSLRHEAESDPHVSDAPDGRTARLLKAAHLKCMGCHTMLTGAQVMEHECLTK